MSLDVVELFGIGVHARLLANWTVDVTVRLDVLFLRGRWFLVLVHYSSFLYAGSGSDVFVH